MKPLGVNVSWSSIDRTYVGRGRFSNAEYVVRPRVENGHLQWTLGVRRKGGTTVHVGSFVNTHQAMLAADRVEEHPPEDTMQENPSDKPELPPFPMGAKVRYTGPEMTSVAWGTLKTGDVGVVVKVVPGSRATFLRIDDETVDDQPNHGRSIVEFPGGWRRAYRHGARDRAELVKENPRGLVLHSRASVLNTPEEMGWLRDVHLSYLDLSKYKSAIIYGNEDFPQRIEVYEKERPRVGDKAVIYEPNARGMYRQRKTAFYFGGKLARPNPVPLEYERYNHRGVDVEIAVNKGTCSAFPEQRPYRMCSEDVFFGRAISPTGHELVVTAMSREGARGKIEAEIDRRWLGGGFAKNPVSKTSMIVAGGVLGFLGIAALFFATSSNKKAIITKDSRVALIGDSLAVGLGPELAKIAAANGVAFQHEGHSGTTPKQWAEHAAACGQCGDWLKTFSPTIVLVELGTNDLGLATPNVSYYQTIRDGIRSLGARVVWVMPNKMSRSELAAVRQTIGSLGVDVVPMAEVPISQDGVHPTSIGFNVWAQKIWKYLAGS